MFETSDLLEGRVLRQRLIRAGLLTAALDGLFSSMLTAVFYGSTIARLWKGVAAVPFGPAALDAGWVGIGAGLALHVAVAFSWSTLFMMLVLRRARLRQVLGSTSGKALAAAFYGPLVWVVMSLAVIPLFTHRFPPLNVRWWIQFVGHIPFVGLPIAASFANPGRRNGELVKGKP